jgi:phosphopantothenoylcysteine decarboxylase / phosphopantothenate---cysteine ligase
MIGREKRRQGRRFAKAGTQMEELAGRRILLGVTGGIAAYKSPDLVRRLREHGAVVQVVMTDGAAHFITPLTLQAVSGQPVRSALWDADAEAAMGHIELARWAELVLVAPATADFIARLAHGLAPDLLSTLCLATEAPVLVAPAMNRVMWANAATRANVELLAGRGIELLGPDAGEQACGETGFGRMSQPADLAAAVVARLATPGVLAGVRVLITAGPTREALDPVRFLSNRSSGKMGFAVARAAAEAGARVVLVAGPVGLPTPRGVERIDVESAREMYDVVHRELPGTHIYVGAAAVADYHVAQPAPQKVKKKGIALDLRLEPAPDILASVTQAEPHPFAVGFAAETQDLERNALDKLARKSIDMIAANEVGAGRAFDTEENALLVLWQGGRREIPSAPKLDVARTLVALIADRYRETRAAARAEPAGVRTP